MLIGLYSISKAIVIESNCFKPREIYMKILVTGAGGMLGSDLVRSLKENRDLEVIGWKRADCDLTGFEEVSFKLGQTKPDFIIHAAAVVGGIQANIERPVDFLTQNLQIDNAVLNGAHACGVQNLVYIGSSCMYPLDFRQPLLESDMLAAPLEPTNQGYAIAKISGSLLSEYMSSQYGVSYKTIIPSNLYGPGDNFDPISSHLIGATLRKAHEAKKNAQDKIDVWGDGEARREFTFIGDLSSWLSSKLENISSFPARLNVGAGIDHSINEYYSMALEVVGHKAELVHNLSKPVGMRQKLMDSSIARDNFDWNPSTSLRDGMTMTYEDFLSGRVQ